MNIGKIISGSQLLQKAEHIENSTSARDRYIEVQKREISDQQIRRDNKETDEKVLDKEQVKELVDSMNDFLEPAHTALKFEFHEKLQEYYVTIINPESKEVIKEIPPKKLLDVYASMAELMGFIVDETA